MNVLRKWIRELLLSEASDDDNKGAENLLMEPDDVDEPETQETVEQSVVANIAGVSTPLGTGPTYPNRGKKRKKSLPKGWQKAAPPKR
jgi:hypothetical protein